MQTAMHGPQSPMHVDRTSLGSFPLLYYHIIESFFL
jgi:hypothetical protein